MLTKTNKLKNAEPQPGDCPGCNGLGVVEIVPICAKKAPFQTRCSDCFGEKSISMALCERKARGAALKTQRQNLEVSMREAANGFKCRVSEWSDAERGAVGLDAIAEKSAFLQKVLEFRTVFENGPKKHNA